jgi:molecular chaperone DnaK (HSP70)
VALGAAIHAKSLLSEKADTYLLDVTPLSLRLGIAGGLSETIVERNTPVPVEARRLFTTAQDFQEAVAVKIYQGESRAADQNALLGEFEFSGYKPGPRGTVKIEVAFSISTEGIVKVSARDPDTGVERSTQVKMSSGLSDAEIQKIIARGRAGDVRTQAPSQRPRPRAFAPPTLIAEDDSEEMVLEPMLPQTPQPAPGKSAGDDELFGAVDGTLTGPDDEQGG